MGVFSSHTLIQTVRNAPRLLDRRVLHLAEVMFVIYPDSEGDQYQIKTEPVAAGSFTTRCFEGAVQLAGLALAART
jgi:hypothetical protein